MLIQDNVKFYRKQRNMTQDQLAEAANLSTSYISQIESGRRNVGLPGLKKISKALDIPVILLLETEEYPVISIKSMQMVKELEKCTPWELEVIWDVICCLKKSIRGHHEQMEPL